MRYSKDGWCLLFEHISARLFIHGHFFIRYKSSLNPQTISVRWGSSSISAFNVMAQRVHTDFKFTEIFCLFSRSQWPRGLRHGSADTRLLVLRVRIPPGTWMTVWSERCLLSGRGLCVRLITRPEESYRVWCVWVWSWSIDSEETLAH